MASPLLLLQDQEQDNGECQAGLRAIRVKCRLTRVASERAVRVKCPGDGACGL